MIRNDEWLRSELRKLWQTNFSDVAQVNPVEIRFGPPARGRFGSIRLTREGTSRILINGVFRDPAVPEPVIRATIGHELVHYAHGFSSEHPLAYAHPHRGGVVDRELRARGLGAELAFQKQWIKEEWERFAPPRRRSPHRRARFF